MCLTTAAAKPCWNNLCLRTFLHWNLVCSYSPGSCLFCTVATTRWVSRLYLFLSLLDLGNSLIIQVWCKGSSPEIQKGGGCCRQCPCGGQTELWAWGGCQRGHVSLEWLWHLLALVTADGRGWGCCELRAQRSEIYRKVHFLFFWGLPLSMFLSFNCFMI